MSYTPPSWYPPGRQAPAPVPRPRRDRALTALAVGLALLVAAVAGAGWYGYGLGDGVERARPANAAPENTAPENTATPSAGTTSPKPTLRTPEPVHVPTAQELAAARRPGEASAWIASDTTDLPRRTVPVDGPWIVGDTIVQALYREVTAYRLSDGAEVWNLTLPTPVCEAPEHATPDGRIVLVLATSGAQRGARCDRFRMIDLRTGKTGWTKELLRDPSRDTPAIIVHTAISGDTLAVAEGLGAAAFRVSDGSRLFTVPTENPGRCHPDQVAGGSRLLVTATCALGVDRRKQYSQLRELDPRTGAVRWRHRTPAGRQMERMISVDPVVYTSIDNERLTEDWRIVALGPRGELRRTIDPRPKGFEHCVHVGIDADLQPCPGIVVGHGLVHVGGTDRVGAYDLATGKLLWGIRTHDGRTLTPVGFRSATGTVVYESATPSRPGRTFVLGKGGPDTEKVLMKHPAAAAEAEYSTMAGRVLQVGGRILAMPNGVSGDDAQRQPRLVSFAPARE
ncbi:PQQ-binding-like beta-propeller repeat protein [Streptomyces sp. R302]|uniref:outer membrane protein assembly factor BamB family protein n=1 Tax=unclassified Streptomyces TaxID=2593676 RepID=UPI00145C4424|nr:MULTISPECIES: PQQ-binding-like beta-propeller repeat protein [unclassified Streptomyces]NML52688.1 PQQ-binding-like beta-propeller repeat protein [Streptomyces sp. R301]NML80383.1 PQQ-binding-like beta-propeller repeat protein [Streptomyces sp. R302]